MKQKNYGQFCAYLLVLAAISQLAAGNQLSVAEAATVLNDSYQIEIEEIDVPVEEQKPTPTPAPKLEPQGGLGITYLPSSFSFTISQPIIDFGVLSATTPVTRKTKLKVSSPGSGYQVFAYANHMLNSRSNVSIPDTTCDNGSCSEITSSIWENNLTYGFGYRCDAPVASLCLNAFEDENDYKQFSNQSKRELPQPVMQNDAKTKNDEAEITYRVNISGTQAKEAYTNSVIYIAVPNF